MAIITFSLISGSIRSLSLTKKLEDILKQKEDEINGYLYEIDKHLPEKKLDYFMYDTSISYIKISYLHGVVQSIKKNDFYRNLSPRLKNKLILEVLGDYYAKFYFFFNDIQGKNFADKAFIRRVLTNLDC